MKGKVFVGLSGGVDSAVSAALLQRQGYDVIGAFIRIAIEGYPCPAAQDRIEAMRVAAHLRIPFQEIDLSKEYMQRVFSHTMQEYARGRTPNPDVLCNREIKFGLFYDWAHAQGADFVATGHYARVRMQGSEARLYAGADQEKDQSYFLWMVPEDHLHHVLFPVGEMRKGEVRALAKKFGLPNATRKDSQGLCFLGDITLGDMLTRELHPMPGDVLNEEGVVVGRHEGVAHYTLGQRHGFVLSNGVSHTHPHYVVGRDTAANTIVVSENQIPQANNIIVTLQDTNWIGTVSDGSYAARYRYRGSLLAADLQTNSVLLHEPRYIPEGQSLVLYHRERCLGGGIIGRTALSC